MRLNQFGALGGASRLLFSLVLAFAAGVSAQVNADETAKPSDTAPAISDYKIGPADVLAISVSDAPEFGGKFRVSDSGVIDIPGVAEPVRAEGQSARELEQAIHQALVDAKQLRDPHVSVFVEEYHGRTVTILGSVAKPSVYPVSKRTNVLEALSMAGGPLPNSGNTVTIVRGAASAEATNTAVGSVQILQMNSLVSGKESPSNEEVRNGDVISVSPVQVIYVVGSVVKPGGYPMSDPSAGVSVVQAVALAGGIRSVASRHGIILRQSTNDGARVEIPVDIGQMIAGKSTDAILAPNDILYIPTSGTRQTLKIMGEAALVAAEGIATYGIGYRIGTQ